MSARTGSDYLKGLRDRREIWIGHQKVTDVTDHPALRGAARALASVFDLQHAAASDCLVPDPQTHEPINVSHLIPRSREDLRRRHRGLRRIAELSVGLLGRTPDYVNVTYAGFAGRHDEWAKNGNEEGAANLVRDQRRIAQSDLALTHAIVHPTIDRSLGDNPGAGVALHKVENTQHGIVVRGARSLATLAPFADEIAVYPGHPASVSADECALAFCIPVATPGLKFICRDSVASSGNRFDHPLSSRFDEQDAFVIFDDVEVPRDRIHIHCNLAVYRKVMRTSWAPNIMQQTMIRAQTKLEFAWGLATRMVESINGAQPPAQQLLGELWSYAELTRAALAAAEDAAYDYGNGVWCPATGPLAALRALLPTWMPRATEIIRLLGSHHLLTAPSLSMIRSAELGPLLDRYLCGVADVSAETRARVFRLAWDFAGTGLAGRNDQYERFYLASGARNQQIAHVTADRTRAFDLVERFLGEDVE